MSKAFTKTPRKRRSGRSGTTEKTGSGVFSATVEYARRDKMRQRATIVGIDEADLANGKISWMSPVARALMKAYVRDAIEFRTPSGPETIEVLSIRYGTRK